MKEAVLLGLLSLFLLAGIVTPTYVAYVSPYGIPNEDACGSELNPCGSLGEALEGYSSSVDTEAQIFVNSGSYFGNTNLGLEVEGQVDIIGLGEVIISGKGSEPLEYVFSVNEGLTIQNITFKDVESIEFIYSPYYSTLEFSYLTVGETNRIVNFCVGSSYSIIMNECSIQTEEELLLGVFRDLTITESLVNSTGINADGENGGDFTISNSSLTGTTFYVSDFRSVTIQSSMITMDPQEDSPLFSTNSINYINLEYLHVIGPVETSVELINIYTQSTPSVVYTGVLVEGSFSSIYNSTRSYSLSITDSLFDLKGSTLTYTEAYDAVITFTNVTITTKSQNLIFLYNTMSTLTITDCSFTNTLLYHESDQTYFTASGLEFVSSRIVGYYSSQNNYGTFQITRSSFRDMDWGSFMDNMDIPEQIQDSPAFSSDGGALNIIAQFDSSFYFDIDIEHTNFTGNSAENGGAFAFTSDPSLSCGYGNIGLQHCEFDSNVVTGNGGAVYLVPMCGFFPYQSTFKDNSATQLGGGIYYEYPSNSGSSSQFMGLSFIGNDADSGSAYACRCELGDCSIYIEKPYVTTSGNKGKDVDCQITEIPSWAISLITIASIFLASCLCFTCFSIIFCCCWGYRSKKKRLLLEEEAYEKLLEEELSVSLTLDDIDESFNE